MDNYDKGMWVQTLWDPLTQMKKSPLESNEPGIRVAAYCRVSQGNRNKSDSLNNQLNHFTQVIKNRQNWDFTGIYFDDSISGANYAKRQGFKRMIRHCEEGKIDLILTKSVSRFSRNTEELIDIVNRLKELNVAVYFEIENIDTFKNNNFFLLSTYAGLAQAEIESLSKSLEWSYEKRFEKGIPLFTRMLGYKIITGSGRAEIKIIESEAKTIRGIFDMYLDGLSFTEIARNLMKCGVKTAFGKDLWTGNAVKHILTNNTYVGNKMTRETTKDIFSNSTRPTGGIRTQFLIEKSHCSIVREETFCKVQERIGMNNLKREVKRKAPQKRPLSGRLKCGNCGLRYQVCTSRKYAYWECRTHIVSKSHCDSKKLDERLIRDMMMKAFKVRFDFDDQNIVSNLFKIIQDINRNDHFEFHRLKFLTEIEIAINTFDLSEGDEKIKEMKQKYRRFEENIVKIEDDRKYRDAAIQWMNTVKSVEEIIDQSTIEQMRAWIRDMTIFSPEDYIVFWIDDVVTEIGECKPRIKPESLDSELNQVLRERDYLTQEIEVGDAGEQ